MSEMLVVVDSAVTVPVNIHPLTDSTDGVSIETGVNYNATGLNLFWNFVTSAGVQTQTAVTPTTGGVYDWTHLGCGMYKIEIPASGGASINNDAKGFGWFSGYATGVMPWRGPVITFAPANVVNSLIDGTDILSVDLTQIDGADTDGYNATLKLKMLDIVNDDGNAISAQGGGVNGNGIYAVGREYSTSGIVGVSILGGDGIAGIGGSDAGAGISGIAQAINSDGFYGRGGEDGAGARFVGTADGPGFVITKGASAVHDLLLSTPSTNMIADANLVSIDGEDTDGNNATLNLKRLVIISDEGSPVVVTSNTTNAPAFDITGNGTGAAAKLSGGLYGAALWLLGGAGSNASPALRIDGGSDIAAAVAITGTNASWGMTIQAGTGKEAVIITGLSDAVKLVAGGNGSGIRSTGSGTGHGGLFTGGNGVAACGIKAATYGTGGSAHGIAGYGNQGSGLYGAGGGAYAGAAFMGGPTDGSIGFFCSHLAGYGVGAQFYGSTDGFIVGGSRGMWITGYMGLQIDGGSVLTGSYNNRDALKLVGADASEFGGDEDGGIGLNIIGGDHSGSGSAGNAINAVAGDTGIGFVISGYSKDIQAKEIGSVFTIDGVTDAGILEVLKKIVDDNDGATYDAELNSLAAIKSQVGAAMGLNATYTMDELAAGALPEKPTMAAAKMLTYMLQKNLVETTSNLQSLYDHAGTSKVLQWSLDDDSTTFTRDNAASGA